MKKCLLLMLIMLLPILSCSNTGIESGGIPEWTSDLMKKVPYDSEMAEVSNVQAIREDPDLQCIYTDWRHTFNFSSVNQYTGSMLNFTYHWPTVCDLNQVDYMVNGWNSSFIIATVDIEKVESFLNDGGWSRSEYDGFTVWSIEVVSGEYSINKSVAFNQTYVIAGLTDWVSSTIDTINGKQPSICEKEQFQDLMALIPDAGLGVTYSEFDFEIDKQSSIKLIDAIGVSKKDGDHLSYTIVVTGENGSMSDDLVRVFIDKFKSDEIFNQSEIKTKRSGIYVIFTADVPLSNLSGR